MVPVVPPVIVVELPPVIVVTVVVVEVVLDVPVEVLDEEPEDADVFGPHCVERVSLEPVPKLEVGDPDVEPRVSLGPVSYTHLTLPTKRIV